MRSHPHWLWLVAVLRLLAIGSWFLAIVFASYAQDLVGFLLLLLLGAAEWLLSILLPPRPSP